MFNFTKIIYNNESYKNVSFNLNEKGLEIIDSDKNLKSYLPFYNIYTVEQTKTTKNSLKSLVGFVSLFVSYIILQSLQFTIQAFSEYGIFQFMMLIVISLSIGYLFAITLLYICTKNEILIWHSIILKNDAAEIRLVYDSEIEQKKSYEQIKKTIEHMSKDEDTTAIPYEN